MHSPPTYSTLLELGIQFRLWNHGETVLRLIHTLPLCSPARRRWGRLASPPRLTPQPGTKPRPSSVIRSAGKPGPPDYSSFHTFGRPFTSIQILQQGETHQISELHARGVLFEFTCAKHIDAEYIADPHQPRQMIIIVANPCTHVFILA